jgi:hypothetical protein
MEIGGGHLGVYTVVHSIGVRVHTKSLKLARVQGNGECLSRNYFGKAGLS